MKRRTIKKVCATLEDEVEWRRGEFRSRRDQPPRRLLAKQPLKLCGM
jgi:hypothetical protein